MKRLKSTFKIVLAATLLLFAQQTVAQQQRNTQEALAPDSLLKRMDTVNISLLTCGPGTEVWSLYGHTAIRYQDPVDRMDVAINYGAFSFEQDFFVLRFIFGLTDYSMDIMPMSFFLNEYSSHNRWVIEQHLNLTNEEKLAITEALYQNYLPENRNYRYNFFYDNCTTRARDIIINHLNISGYTSDKQWNGESYRTMTHQWTENNRWTRFGNDLLLGIASDFHTDKEASFFLPDSVRKEFDQMVVTNHDGSRRQFVSSSEWLIPQHIQPNAESSILNTFSPRMMMGGICCIVLLLSLLQWRTGRNMWVLDQLLLLATGLAGIIPFAMLFSQHPTVRMNLQLLILNPLTLFFLYPIAKKARQRLMHRYWHVILMLTFFFFIGGIWQTYAEGMYFLACSLLIRYVANRYWLSHKRI